MHDGKGESGRWSIREGGDFKTIPHSRVTVHPLTRADSWWPRLFRMVLVKVFYETWVYNEIWTYQLSLSIILLTAFSLSWVTFCEAETNNQLSVHPLPGGASPFTCFSCYVSVNCNYTSQYKDMFWYLSNRLGVVESKQQHVWYFET